MGVDVCEKHSTVSVFIVVFFSLRCNFFMTLSEIEHLDTFGVPYKVKSNEDFKYVLANAKLLAFLINKNVVAKTEISCLILSVKNNRSYNSLNAA